MRPLRAFWASSTRNKIALSLAGLVLICGCLPSILLSLAGSPPPAPTAADRSAPASAPTTPPAPTTAPTDAPATATPNPEPGYASGALGLGRPAFEARFGPPTREAPGGIVFYGPELSVIFLDGTVWQIERSWGDGPVSLDEARAAARALLPADAALVETSTSPAGATVDRYTSPSLIDRFPAATAIGSAELSSWPGGEPGDHIVIYRADQRGVFGAVIGIGNTP